MCGIAGIFSFKATEAVDPSVLKRMRDTMSHRGPDGAGLWISTNGRIGLAHRRLSIIDLNTSASQPMPNEDDTVLVTFNGEIYNHRALRVELLKAGHRFRTDHSDTEVLVHGYEQWGIDGLLERIEGDFAFALWDETSETLHLARDRIGVKPIYFWIHEGLLLFGSEIKSIVAHPSVRRDIDPVAMYHYLSFLTTPAPMTMFKGVYKVPAGWRVSQQRGSSLRARQYWSPTPGKGIAEQELTGMSAEARDDYYVQGIRSRLIASVEKRMMSDVPFGVFLSGGVDSSTNVALMSQFTDQPVNTFTVGFKDHTELNELEWADMVARQFKTKHRTVLIDERDMVGYLDSLIHHQDEPIADWVCVPLYFVSKLARESGITVVQVGEGSDEQFAGYDYYLKYLRVHREFWAPFQKFAPRPLKCLVGEMARSLGSRYRSIAVHADFLDRAARNRELFWSGATVLWDLIKHRSLLPVDLPPADMPQDLIDAGLLDPSYLKPDSFNVMRSIFGPLDLQHPGLDELTRMIHSELRLRLPELLLMRVDKITMSTSIEGRVPFLDHSLVDFTMDIPEEAKVRGGEPKHLLKRAVKGWIPDEIIHRKKFGFSAPMKQWLQGPFGERVERQLLSSALMKRGWFDVSFIHSLCKEHRAGRRDNSVYIWTLFNLTAWYDYWIEPATH
jgi:asparagine synthase (glutamine-hydrolysing)